MGKEGSGRITRKEKMELGHKAPGEKSGVICPSSGMHMDLSVCIVRKTRMLKGCVTCTEVGI